MKDIVRADNLVPFLNQKNKTDLKFRNEGIIERKEFLLNKVSTVDEEEGTVECIITTQDVDRVGDIVVSSGVDTSEFTKIPSVFVNHDYAQLPCGKCEELIHKDGSIHAKIKFVLSVPAVKDIFERVKAGVLRGISIGFDASEVILRGTKSFDDYCKSLKLGIDDLERVRRIIPKWKLYEFSVCSIPANPSCTTKTLEVKDEPKTEVKTEEVVKEIPKEDAKPAIVPETKAEVKEEVEEIEIEIEDASNAIADALEKRREELDKGDIIEKELVLKPFPNEHAARQESPDKYERFRRQNDKFAEGLNAIWGITGDGKTELQSIRASADKWTVEAFKKWLKDHGFKTNVEPATGQHRSIEPEPIEIIPHVKRYIQVLKTPEEDEEYIRACVEARLRGKPRIRIM